MSTPVEKHKLVFLGDIYVGKTSILTRFMHDTFDVNYQATIGIDFLSKSMYLAERTVRLQLWDTAGQERFRSLIPNYIRDSAVAIVVFDVSNKQSFENISIWIQDVRSERGQSAAIVIVGNKIDKIEDRVVTFEEASEAAKGFEASYLETSAKTGENVEELFNLIGKILPSADRPSIISERPEIIDIKAGAQQAETQKKDCKC